MDDGAGGYPPARRDGGSGGAPRLKRSALVSRANARGSTEVKRTKNVKERVASLSMAARSREHKRGVVLGNSALCPCS